MLNNSKSADRSSTAEKGKSFLGDLTASDLKSVSEELVLDTPFAYVVLNEKSQSYCNHCFSKKLQKLHRCSACKFAFYCSPSCQKAAWKFHKLECQRLKTCYPNAPHTETLLFGRIIDRLIPMLHTGAASTLLNSFREQGATMRCL